MSTERQIDEALVKRAQAGDKRAFELLVSKYQRRILRLLSRILHNQSDVEDIAQETFLKAYRALPKFRNESAFYTWLIVSLSIQRETIFPPNTIKYLFLIK